MAESLFKPAEPAPESYVRVAVERGFDAPDGLTYAAPSSMPDLAVGERVIVPLGRGDARTEGYIVEIGVRPDFDPDRIKSVATRTGARLPPRLVELARWIAAYYCCPLGMTLASMIPAPVKREVGRITRTELRPSGAEPINKLAPATAEAWEKISRLPSEAFPLTERELQRRIEADSVGPIRRLLRADLLEESVSQSVRALAAIDTGSAEPMRAVQLTPEQHAAVGAVNATSDTFTVHLLFGVTGSGKTEVYLRALDEVVERGRCAIVLVPEISLTPQTVARFVHRFRSAGVAVLHSGLTAAQRNQQWRLLHDGKARIVVGARSAVFAPFDAAGGAPLGLIVVDEEHDSAYKQDQAPRYHARDVAIRRAQIENCPVLLGSATPSLESWRNALRERYRLHRLPARVAGAAMPRVEIVDLKEELRALARRERGVRLIGPRLHRALEQTLHIGAQAMLLLNRRGYANYICCPDHRCGWVMSCEDCDAAMVYHRDRNLPLGGLVRCHHCMAEMKLPPSCPICGRRVNTFGMGTQRVEEELTRLFPSLAEGESLVRLDSDAIRGARQWGVVLDRFRSGEIRVLLGTQMIAKGHDFPNVRLVGVINADTSLNLPDFRAAERTFQLVSQVAGRAGRTADRPGLVIVQTFSPETPAIQCAAAHDFTTFAREELAVREPMRLPPIGRMARIVVRDKDPAKAMTIAREICSALRDDAGDGLIIRDPFPCPISRIGGAHRIAIELMAASATPIQRALTGARNRRLFTSDARTAVDVDPIALL